MVEDDGTVSIGAKYASAASGRTSDGTIRVGGRRSPMPMASSATSHSSAGASGRGGRFDSFVLDELLLLRLRLEMRL